MTEPTPESQATPQVPDTPEVQATLEDSTPAPTEPSAAETSETEKQRHRADAAEAREKEKVGLLRRYIILDAARDEAERQGMHFNPGALPDAYDLQAFAAVGMDENGRPTGVADALKALAKAKPYLLKPKPQAAAPDIDATRSGSGSHLDSPAAQTSRRHLTRGF